MEVNTRLQVEHPVTEMVTGIDIVKEQIRIAAGERLSFKQSDVTFTGHAIECRDQRRGSRDVRAVAGVIHAFSVPGGPGVRVDTFAHSECTISPYYDSMIAKIIVHGRDRQEAIARMRRTLEMTVIEGIKTSIPLHLKILADPDFVAGRLSTSFMERFLVEKKAGGGRPRRSGLKLRSSTPSTAPILYAIIDTERLRGARARAASPSRDACLAGGARCCSCATRPASSGGVPGAGRRAGRAARDGVGAARHRQRPRGHRALVGRRRRARRAGRSRRRRGARDRRADAIVGLSTHDARTDRSRARRATASYVAVGPVFGTSTKETGYDARGLDLVAARRRPREAGRRDRRHHAGERTLGDRPPARPRSR